MKNSKFPTIKKEYKKQVSNEEIAKALLMTHGIATQAAKLLSDEVYPITNSAIGKRAKESEIIQKAMKQAKNEMLDVAESKLFEQIEKGNMAAIAFYLKTHGQERGYIEKQRTEIANADGKAFKTEQKAVIDLSKMNPDDVMKISRELFRKE